MGDEGWTVDDGWQSGGYWSVAGLGMSAGISSTEGIAVNFNAQGSVIVAGGASWGFTIDPSGIDPFGWGNYPENAMINQSNFLGLGLGSVPG